MATNIGLPSLTIAFRKAAQAAANRSKKGYVGVFVRDAKAQGVHQLTSPALIPSELGRITRHTWSGPLPAATGENPAR